MPSKFILLDIDGVMVTGNAWKPVEVDDDLFFKFNPNAQQSLDNLLLLSKAEIVLTTTHRNKYSKLQWDLFLKKRLRYYNRFTILEDYLGKISENLGRYGEIMYWATGPGLNKQYVILDDDKQLYDLPLYIKKHWIPISPGVGLNETTGFQALRVLNESI